MYIENNNFFNAKKTGFGMEYNTGIQNIGQNLYEENSASIFENDTKNSNFQTNASNYMTESILNAPSDNNYTDSETDKRFEELLNFVQNNQDTITQKANSNLDKNEEEIKDTTINDPVLPDNLDLIGLSNIVRKKPEPPAFSDSEDSGAEYTGNFDINGQIEASKQGILGDCWFLAGVNSLSYSENGREIIKESIINNNDGTYTVNFKGADVAYTISDEVLEKARATKIGDDTLSESIYSTGDDDVLLLEIATEAFLTDLENEEIDNLPQSAPDFLYQEEGNPLNGGFPADIVYLLTGENMEYKNITTPDNKYLEGDELQSFYDNDLEDFYTKFEQNPNNSCGTIHIKKDNSQDIVVTDIKGEDCMLTKKGENHSWSVKSVDENTVTMVNPWDSNNEVTVDKAVLEQHVLGFEYLAV